MTDPPAGIGFMGKSWDRDKGGRTEWIDWLAGIMGECLRVVKPGGSLLCWSIPRTSHWTGMAVEDAGWRVVDKIAHLFGTGFPKSLDIGKAIGAEREVVWDGWGTALKPSREDWWLAYKPTPLTYAQNAIEHGVAGLAIDRGRIAHDEGVDLDAKQRQQHDNEWGGMAKSLINAGEIPMYKPSGRWPASRKSRRFAK